MENNLKYNLLRTLSFFSCLKSDELLTISKLGELKKIKKRQDFYFSDHKLDKLYFITKGMAKVMINEDGNEKIKELLQENDFFGYIFLEKKYTIEDKFVRVLSDEMLVISFSADEFENILKEKPELSLQYTKKIGEKLRLMENRFSDLIHKTTKARLISFLKNFAMRNGKNEFNKVTSRYFLTQEDIAGLIGTSRQTVTTLMNELESYNQLHYTRSTLTFYLNTL